MWWIADRQHRAFAARLLGSSRSVRRPVSGGDAPLDIKSVPKDQIVEVDNVTAVRRPEPLGANNTGNAVGVFYGLHKMSEMQAGFVGGIVMALGALTWGRPILDKIGKGLVDLDPSMGRRREACARHNRPYRGVVRISNVNEPGAARGHGRRHRRARGREPISQQAIKEIVFSRRLQTSVDSPSMPAI